MPSPQVFPPEPPEFHPEFGYFWPAAQTRRLVSVGLLSTVFGLLFGAIAVVAMTPRADPGPGPAETALCAASVDEPVTVGVATSASVTSATAVDPAIAPISAAAPTQSTATATKSCREQIWPYLDGNCLNNTARKRPPARVLKPEAPAQSAPAQVVPVPTPEITAAARAAESSKASRKREKMARMRQRERDRGIAERERGRYADPRSAYASPYVSRSEMPRRGWDW
jgi:hypothetical protein